MAASLFVNLFKIRMPQKTALLGKPGSGLQASGFRLQDYRFRTLFGTLFRSLPVPEA